MGATVNLRVVIGAYARIGNSAVVKQSVPEKGIVKAGAVWPAS
jgi:acetyltransferase-like isoleucine patch superfamily enzyme